MHNISALTTTCDKKIIKIYIPGTDLAPGGIRATGIQLRIAGPNCCTISNIIDIPVPPPPPPPPQPTPNQCLPTLDLYGYSAIVSYDPVNCRAGHACNAAIFDLYIDNYFIGQANLNNANNGGYREGVFIINEHIITNINTTVELRCALARCHQGIGRIAIKDPGNNIIFSSCLPNDSIVGIGNNICPTPTVTTTPTPTPTTTPPPFSPFAVVLTSGTSYAIPSGATTMTAWAVGAGGGYDYGGLSPWSARGGSIAYKTWNVSSGQSVAYSIPSAPSYQLYSGMFTGSKAHTTITFNNQTILGFNGGDGIPKYSINDETEEGSGISWLQFSGGEGLALGGGHQTNSPNSGYYYRGGAAGGNSPSPSCGANGFRRNVLTDISGLKAALTLAGAKVTDNCNDPQAFGNGGLDSKFNGVLSAGLGGGAINMQAGNGAVILYFT